MLGLLLVLGVEIDRQLLALLLRRRDGHEVAARPPPLDDFGRDVVLLVELEVPGRLVERRVEDGFLMTTGGMGGPSATWSGDGESIGCCVGRKQKRSRV